MALLGRVGGYGGALSPISRAPVGTGCYTRKRFSQLSLFPGADFRLATFHVGPVLMGRNDLDAQGYTSTAEQATRDGSDAGQP